MGQDIPDELSPLKLTDIIRRDQQAPLDPPITNPPALPLSQLDHSVFERLVTEMVTRHDNLDTMFYGRSGQKQFGLDIVEILGGRRTVLYQVKRLKVMTPAALREAVVTYAGPPRPHGHGQPPRLFDPQRFVVATSADVEGDTANVNELHALQDEYEGDLEIVVWDRGKLGRILRDMGSIVYAIFGSAWADVWCGFRPGPMSGPSPDSFGFVNDPIEVLGLGNYQTDAEAAQQEGEHSRAAHLYGVLVRELRQAGFPSHAVPMLWLQSKALEDAGRPGDAYDLFFELTLEQLRAGWSSETTTLRTQLKKLAPQLDRARQLRFEVLECLASWYRTGSHLTVVVPALEGLAGVQDPMTGLLTCLALEQAVVDGLYDFVPTRSVLADVGPDAPELLARLRSLAEDANDANPLVRARLRCAVADASLTLADLPEIVDSVYRPVVDDASAGRFHDARGLVTARAARASALAGDAERADNRRRQAILGSSESRLYGDTRGVIRAAQFLSSDNGMLRFFGPNGDLSFLPNRSRMLAGGFDPALSTLAEMHEGRFPDALGSARRLLLESRLSGHVFNEFHALGYLADIFVTGGFPAHAIVCYVDAGEGEKAAAVASQLDYRIDMGRQLDSRVRRRCAAAIQVVSAQSQLIPDSDLSQTVDRLLDIAAALWNVPWNSPNPEYEALKAVTRFGVRIPSDGLDRLLALASPTEYIGPELVVRQGQGIAEVLVQAYWALEEHRPRIAKALSILLRLSAPPPNLWDLIRNIPPAAAHHLLPTVHELAEEPNEEAVLCLAVWGQPHASRSATRSAVLRGAITTASGNHRPQLGHRNTGIGDRRAFTRPPRG